MQMRAMGPGAGWRWLMQGINLGRNNPKALFGAAALLLLLALVPTIVQLLAQNVLGITGMSMLYVLVGFSLLYSVVVMPLMMGGFLRVIHAVETGRPTHATAIFEPFRAGNGGGRLIALSLLLLLFVIVVFAAIMATVGNGIGSWYLQLMVASQGAVPGTPPNIPPLPSGFGTFVGLSLLVGLFVQGLYGIAFGQAALGGRSPGGAFIDGLAGAAKNLLPLLVLLVVLIIAVVLASLVVGLLALLLGVIGALISPALTVILAAPVYIAFLLMLYVVMFGVMYAMWRDIAAPSSPSQAARDDVVAA